MIRWRKKTVWMRNITYSGLFMKFFSIERLASKVEEKYSGFKYKEEGDAKYRQ